jgi:hypothetical protein
VVTEGFIPHFGKGGEEGFGFKIHAFIDSLANSTTPKRGGIKGDPKRVSLVPELELFHALIFFQLPSYRY